jgi:hypothetical protein
MTQVVDSFPSKAKAKTKALKAMKAVLKDVHNHKKKTVPCPASAGPRCSQLLEAAQIPLEEHP